MTVLHTPPSLQHVSQLTAVAAVFACCVTPAGDLVFSVAAAVTVVCSARPLHRLSARPPVHHLIHRSAHLHPPAASTQPQVVHLICVTCAGVVPLQPARRVAARTCRGPALAVPPVPESMTPHPRLQMVRSPPNVRHSTPVHRWSSSCIPLDHLRGRQVTPQPERRSRELLLSGRRSRGCLSLVHPLLVHRVHSKQLKPSTHARS